MILLPFLAYTLVWKPALGEELRQSLRFEMHFEDEDILYTADLTTIVEQVGSDGSYTLRNSSANTKMVVGSKEIPDEESKDIREKYDAQGRRLDIDDFGDPYSNLMGVLTEFYPPSSSIDLGATWTHQIVKNAATGEPLTFMDYRLVGEEAGNLRVDFTYKQLFTVGEPITASGKFLIHRETYALVGYEGTALNVRENPFDAPGTIKITLTRRK